jgi:hypothetical protein
LLLASSIERRSPSTKHGALNSIGAQRVNNER